MRELGFNLYKKSKQDNTFSESSASIGVINPNYENTYN